MGRGIHGWRRGARLTRGATTTHFGTHFPTRCLRCLQTGARHLPRQCRAPCLALLTQALWQTWLSSMSSSVGTPSHSVSSLRWFCSSIEYLAFTFHLCLCTKHTSEALIQFDRWMIRKTVQRPARPLETNIVLCSTTGTSNAWPKCYCSSSALSRRKTEA